MSEHQHHHPEESPWREHFESLTAELAALTDAMAQNFVGGEIERIRFDGKNGPVVVTDDRGSNAVAYAVYNPNNFRVFVGLAGGSASADAGLIVPKQKLVVAPLIVNGSIQLAADAGEIAEGAGNILRVRFPTPQAFAVYALT